MLFFLGIGALGPYPVYAKQAFNVDFGGGLANANLSRNRSASGGYGHLGFDIPLLSSHWTSLNLGAQGRGVSVSSQGASEEYLFALAKARIEFWNFSLGGAYTPYVYSSSLSKYQGMSSTLVDVELLLPITPEIDFGIMASRQWMQTGDQTRSFNPASLYGAFFRLHYGYSESGKNSRRTFKGWRYPFGVRRR